MTARSTDHFSAHAQNYAQFRPDYPAPLFAWLAKQCPGHQLAWDCGTGNGQAAVGLAPHFDAVLATDLSPEQLAHAPARANVRYAACVAEDSGLADCSADLITVAQALHWFDHDRFYPEVLRVLKPGGIFAAWTYRLLDAEPAVNEIVADFHGRIIGPWWPPERRWVDSGYQGLPFPFSEIPVPGFSMVREWTLSQMLDYLRTWSATQRYMKERGTDPTEPLAERLRPTWGNPDHAKRITWPLAIRCGRRQ